MIMTYQIKLEDIERKVNPTEVEDLKSLFQSNPQRPPKIWWIKTYKKTKMQYPGYSPKKLNKMVGGIWINYSDKSKKRIITLDKKKGV